MFGNQRRSEDTMLSFLQDKLGTVLGTIVGYIPNLIVSPVLLVLAVLFQPWVWLDLTWGIVGTTLGLLSGLIMTLLGGEVRPRWGKYAKVVAPNYLDNWGGAYSLGPVLTGYSQFSDWTHEYGHTWQNRILGPLYLFVIAIPSLISAASKPGNHSHFYTEEWADKWSSWV
jgi:MFS family permease